MPNALSEHIKKTGADFYHLEVLCRRGRAMHVCVYPRGSKDRAQFYLIRGSVAFASDEHGSTANEIDISSNVKRKVAHVVTDVLAWMWDVMPKPLKIMGEGAYFVGYIAREWVVGKLGD